MPTTYIEEAIDSLIKTATRKEISDDDFNKIKKIIYELGMVKKNII